MSFPRDFTRVIYADLHHSVSHTHSAAITLEKMCNINVKTKICDSESSQFAHHQSQPLSLMRQIDFMKIEIE